MSSSNYYTDISAPGQARGMYYTNWSGPQNDNQSVVDGFKQQQAPVEQQQQQYEEYQPPPIQYIEEPTPVQEHFKGGSPVDKPSYNSPSADDENLGDPIKFVKKYWIPILVIIVVIIAAWRWWAVVKPTNVPAIPAAPVRESTFSIGAPSLTDLEYL